MAGETTIGKLVVRLLMDDKEFNEGTKRATSQLDRMGNRFSSLAQSMNRAVVGAFAAATAAVTAFGAASAVTGAKFEQAITTTAAISKDGMASIGALTEKARELGATTAYSATQAADAMQDLARAGMNTDEITAASEAALLLAGSVGAEMTQATNLMASAMSQFQLDASEASRVSDVFSTAMRTTLFDMGSLTEAMKYAGTVGKGLGYSIEETTAAVAMFRNLGLEGSMAGTNFRMSLSALLGPGDKAATAIKELGLELDEVNPAMVDFGTVMQRFGEAGLDAATAIEIFGQRSGTNMAAIAGQFADGTTKFHEVLEALNTSAGSTAETYAAMMDTVLGQWQILRSAIEELSLVVFDTFAGPLQTVLEALSSTVQYVASEFKSNTDRIRGGIQGLADGFAGWLDDNKDAIVEAFVAVADIIQTVIEYVPVLVQNLDKIAVAVAAIYAVVQTVNVVIMVGQAVMAVQALIPVLAAAQAQVVALIGTISAGTGGLYLLVVAIGAVVTALGALAFAYTEAERAARAMEQAEVALQQRAADATSAYADRTAEAVYQSKQLQAETRQLLAEEDALTRLREEELNLIRDLTDEELASAVQRGEMITTLDGKLRTVKSLYEEWGEEAMPTIDAALNQHNGEIAAMTAEYTTVADAINEVLYFESKLGERGSGEATRLAAWGGTVEAAQEYLGGLEDIIGEEKKAADTIRADLGEAKAAAARDARRIEEKRLADEKRDREAAAREFRQQEAAKTAAAEREAEARAKAIAAAQASASAQMMALEERLHADRQTIGLEGAELRRAQFDAELAAAQASYMEALEAFEGNVDAQADVLARWDAYRHSAEMAFIAEETALHQNALDDQAQREIAARQQVDQTLLQMQIGQQQALAAEAVAAAQSRRDKISAVERQHDVALMALNAQREAFFRDNADMTLEQHLAAVQHFTTEERRLTERAAADVKAIRDSQNSEFIASLDRVVSASKRAAKAMTNAFSKMGETLGTVIDASLGAFTTLTGFAFDLVKSVDEINAAKTDAVGEGESFDTTTAAEEMISGLIDGAIGMVQTFIDAAPVLIGALADQLPILIAKVTESIPVLLNSLIGALQPLIEALVASIPPLVDAVVDALPKVIDFIGRNLPIVIDMLLGEIPKLIDAVVDALPSVISILSDAIVQIVTGIPALVQQLLDAIPTIITSLFEAIPQIIMAVFDAIPKIIDSVIAALPDIVLALIDGILTVIVSIAEQLPFLLARIIELVPELILAIVGMIPEIITSLIAAIPMIISGLIQGLPELITALVTLMPTIIVGLIQALPELITAVVQGIIFELLLKLPSLIADTVRAVIEGLWEAFQQLVAMITEAITGALDFFGGERDRANGEGRGAFREWVSGGSAYSGIDYVPAPMRVTVHPGEAIVPADRNMTGPRSGDGAAPPAAFIPAAPGGGGSMKAEIIVQANGRVLDQTLVESMDSGQAPAMSRRLARASGVVTGYSRGRLNKWGA